MSFEIGQTVVYPHHGAATIEEITTRSIRGAEKTYLKLRVNQGDLTIEVPADNVDLVGVRDIVDEDGLEEVLSVLRAPYVEEPTNWSRRFKANQEKIATGDIVKVAEVVRDLTRRDDLKKLSTGEKRMLTKARGILTSELALARGIDNRPVQPQRERLQISTEITLPQDLPLSKIVRHLADLAQDLWAQAQRKQVQAHTLTLKLKTVDFHILTRSQTYSSVLPDAAALEQAARQLAQRMPAGRDYRLIGLGISHLLPQGSQPELWAEQGIDTGKAT